MAKQNNLFKLQGTIGDATFYKTKDGHLVREKGGVSANRIKTDPSFQRTRENMSDFAYSAQATRLLRDAFIGIIGKAGDKDFGKRLMQTVRAAINDDFTHDRGQRTLNNSNLSALARFEFNAGARLSSVIGCQAKAEVNRVTGTATVTTTAVSPNKLVYPIKATHFRFVAAAAALDFANGELEIAEAESDMYTIGNELINVDPLVLSLTPALTLPIFVVLGIEFYVEHGTKLYLENDETHSPFKILTVSFTA